MTWHLKNIPKVAHFYWGNEHIPWVRYLSLATFARHNPDWTVKLWQPSDLIPLDPDNAQRAGPDYRPFLTDWNVVTQVVDIEPALGIDLRSVRSPYVRRSIQSDYFRHWILATEGGLYSDTDVLYFRPLDQASFNQPEAADAEESLCIVYIFYKNYYLNMFLMAQPGSSLYSRVLAEGVKIDPADFKGGEYFSRAGNVLLDQVCSRAKKAGVINVPWQEVDQYVGTPTIFFDRHNFFLHDTVFALHWHGSGSYGTWMDLRPETIDKDDTLMGSIMRVALYQAAL